MAIERAEKVNILGFGISRLTVREIEERADQLIRGGGRHYILASNVHTVMTGLDDDHYRMVSNRADICVPDGQPLIWAARLLEREKLQRVCGRDLMTLLCEKGLERGYSHFFYGGREATLSALVSRLRVRYSGLRIAGSYSPPFRPLTPEEDAQTVRMINESGADIVWVGLGAPKQERWIGEHAGRIASPVMVAVGAAFDFLAGNVSLAPGWVQKAGLEWLFRFFVEPRRLWRRYILNNPRFVYFLICQRLGLRKFPLSDRP